MFPYNVAYYFVVVTGTSGTAVSRQQIGVRARQLRTPLHQTLDIPILQYKHNTLWRDSGDETPELCLKHDCFYYAAACPARVSRVGKILSIGILFSSIVASWSKRGLFQELIKCVQFSNRKCLFPDRYSCFDSIARTEERCSEDGDTAFAGIQLSRSHTCIPHTYSMGLEKHLRPQKHGFQRSNLWKASGQNECKARASPFPTGFITWTFRTTLSWWRVWVGTVKGRTGASVAHYTAILWRREGCVVSLKMNRSVLSLFKQRHFYLTGTDFARLVRGWKPLAVAIDAMVIGATFTRCTAGTWGQ